MVGELSKRQIDDLLKERRFARLGCHVGGKTYIVPISFAFDGNRLVGQTTPGLKVEMMRQNPEVCVQVDDIEDLTNWRSAIVWGTYQELSGAEKAAAMGLLIDRYGEAFGEAEKKVRRGRETAPPRLDGLPSVAVVYAIAINECSGRFEIARPDSMKEQNTMTQEIMDCIDACTSCMQLCQECADACEKMGGMDECVRLCRLCHDKCDRHSKAIHNDDHSHLESCISICERCADECAKGAEHMAICGRCAAACRKCAEACRRASPANVEPKGGCCQEN